MARFDCRYCGGSIEYAPDPAISKALTEHVYACKARAAQMLDCDTYRDGDRVGGWPGPLYQIPEAGLDLSDLPPVPTPEEALGIAVARNAAHSPLQEGDDLRALIEVELMLVANWAERHGCNCGRHLQGGTAERF